MTKAFSQAAPSLWEGYRARLRGSRVLVVTMAYTAVYHGSQSVSDWSSRVIYRRDVRWAHAWAHWIMHGTRAAARRIARVERLIDYELGAPGREWAARLAREAAEDQVFWKTCNDLRVIKSHIAALRKSQQCTST